MTKRKHKKHVISRFWHRFAFKHTATAIIIGALFIFLLDTAIVQALLNNITSLGYVGIILCGVLSVSFFTAVPAAVLLLAFAQIHNPYAVALIAGAGAVVGDFIILRFAEDRIARELKPIARRLKLMSFIRILHKKRLKPVTAAVGALIIASPLPDEAGMALFGLSKIKTIPLLGMTFVLNSAGIFAFVLAFE